MINDYYKTITKVSITQTADGKSGFTETQTTTEIQGYISELSGFELIKNQRLTQNATSRIVTNETLDLTDKIIDTYGYFSPAGTQFEIVFAHNNQHQTEKYYDLKIE